MTHLKSSASCSKLLRTENREGFAYKLALLFYIKATRSIKAYTGLPVVRVTQKQKALNLVVLNCRVSVNFFQVEGH